MGGKETFPKAENAGAYSYIVTLYYAFVNGFFNFFTQNARNVLLFAMIA